MAMAAGAASADTTDQLRPSWPENDLERLLVARAMDRARSPDFIRGLLKSEICALAQKPLPDATDASRADRKIALLAVKAPDGLPAAPVFTSRHRGTDVFGEDQPIVCGKADVLLNALRGERIVIDPGQPFGVIYTAEELDHILGVQMEITNSDIVLQPPNDAPAAMVRKLTDVLKAEPGVTSAWLSLAYYPAKKEWSWFLNVGTTLDADTVHLTLRDVARGIDMLGRPLDIAINAPIEMPEKGLMLFKR
ncbi:MAG TPA: enhanced serine sensitivity protein SseB C-terminal domain-containing protein [Rhizomicrobium sp.]